VIGPLAIACVVSIAQASGSQDPPTVLERFLARYDPPPTEYRALRHLDARNEHFGASAWMDAWTEVDPGGGFRYQIVAEGGSGYVRSHVLAAALAGEQKLWASRDSARAALTRENYVFADHEWSSPSTDRLTTLRVTPRRKDVLLINGAVFVDPGDADLMRVEGRLSKTPSFWTRRVEVVRRYQRINGVRVPISIESVAQVLIAGRSTFQMTYEYETINGERVGTPQPRIQSSW
jgi:hypothetical protein